MLRKWIFTGLIGGLLASGLFWSAAGRLGLLTVDFLRPDTHWFWYVSRAAGVGAYLALALSVIWGLLLSTSVADAWIARARSVEVHRWISAVALMLIAIHPLVLIGDPYVRFDALDVLVPFASVYRSFAVGVGVVSAYASLVVFGSFWLRRHVGQRTWRMVHWLAFPTFALVTLHGLLAGTDTGTAWMRAVYLMANAVILWLVTYRILVRLVTRVSKGVTLTGRRADETRNEQTGGGGQFETMPLA